MKLPKKNFFLAALGLLVFLISNFTLSAETGKKILTVEDYARAEKYLSQYTEPLVFGGSVLPSWIDEDSFWYRNNIQEGYEFVLVDMKNKKRQRAFDHQQLAKALSQASGESYEPFQLPFRTIEFSDDRTSISFKVDSVQYTYDLKKNLCTKNEKKVDLDRQIFVSPDGKLGAFIRDYNLWVRDLSSGEETQLTRDGIKDFGYATNNAGWIKSERPVLLWSPDSKKIATFQHDGRKVGEMYLVTTNVGHPKLEAWKYPLPGDDSIFQIHRVIIHLDGPRIVRLQMPPDMHRSTITDHIALGNGELADAEWSPDCSQFAFASVSRDHQQVVLRIAEAATGEVRDILEEKVDTFFESGFNQVNWHILPESNEVLWFSQRDDWGHLYLYDLNTGQLKRRLTEGSWNVLQVLKIDRKERVIYFTGCGRENGDPYFQYLYRVGMDGSEVELLTPEISNHTITFSPSGQYFVHSRSTPVEPPISEICDLDGRKILTLEKADISSLIEEGWKPPVPFTVKARDGKTDLYGLMFKPTNFDPNKKYPIINYIYPGPQTGSVGSRSFRASHGENQALAELGFIVVAIDAMGTPMRSKSFQAAYYGNLGDNGLPDQVTAMKQLAERYPWIDIDRAGIYGHSGGGFASTGAILRYPDFFKVAVSSAGNHDNRNYEDDWGEKWQGLLEVYPDGTTNYDNQANQLQAKNLKGKLLLAHGTMDSNVPMYNTLLVVNELIAANKDFDLILFPNRGHGFGREAYMMRRRWDYFVKHLLGAEPPKEYQFKNRN
ncbi:MAG: DPP IV N-terminal domain-containing protein [Acidobacteriota bacterium]|nr:DPP IV N-terminal domain-containing protein [Acidobacteriota bacterium]MDW3229250.1 DPP IV N-terminal domain-containing protein [Acidobacteriota bacterium]